MSIYVHTVDDGSFMNRRYVLNVAGPCLRHVTERNSRID